MCHETLTPQNATGMRCSYFFLLNATPLRSAVPPTTKHATLKLVPGKRLPHKKKHHKHGEFSCNKLNNNGGKVNQMYNPSCPGGHVANPWRARITLCLPQPFRHQRWRVCTYYNIIRGLLYLGHITTILLVSLGYTVCPISFHSALSSRQ